MSSKYRSVQAHSIRSLGVLGDREIVPQLLTRLEDETDVGLQLAYSSTLGRLQVEEATGRLLDLLCRAPSRSARQEMMLDVARLVGHEHHFIHFMRYVRREPGTALARALGVLRKRAEKSDAVTPEVLELIDACAGSLAREELDRGLVELSELARPAAAGLPVRSPAPDRARKCGAHGGVWRKPQGVSDPRFAHAARRLASLKHCSVASESCK